MHTSTHEHVIAIDGYSSSGKGTLARDLAKKLNYTYIDTGAMYRMVTLYFLQNKVDIEDEDAVKKALQEIKISFEPNTKTGASTTYLNGNKVEQEIRSMEVSNNVSKVSAIKSVRKQMVDLQRSPAHKFMCGTNVNKGIVMDGRDIGTVVFPDAALKIFMTAELEVRAKRRYQELTADVSDNLMTMIKKEDKKQETRNKKQAGIKITLEQVKKNIKQRDHEDSHRAESPLKRAADAITIDNTHLTPEQQLDIAYKLVNEKINA